MPSLWKQLSSHRYALWLLAAPSLLGYLALRLWFPLPPYFSRAPLADVRTFTPSLAGGLKYALWLLLLYSLYLLAYSWARRRQRPFPLAPILLTTLLFSLPLLTTFPFNASDVYRYVIRGRVHAVYDANPFATPPDAFPSDPFLPLAGEWAGESSPYGPLWELGASGVAAVIGENLYLGLLLFKGLGMLAHLGIAGLIWALGEKKPPARRAAQTLLWAWNPALLLIFVVNAHNDAWMLLWLLLGWWLAQRERPFLGWAVMLLAPLTKPIGLLPLPLFLLAVWQQQQNWPARLRFLAWSGISGVTAVFLAFLPFGSPLDLAQRLLREAAGGAGFSPASLAILVVRRLGVPLGIDQVGVVGTAVFVMLALLLLWLTWQGRLFTRSAADIFAAYLVTALNFRIWYAAWLFPWTLVTEEKGRTAVFRRQVGLWFLLASQLSVIIYGHLWANILGSDQLLSHLIGVPFTFALPLLLAWWMTGRRHTRPLPAAD